VFGNLEKMTGATCSSGLRFLREGFIFNSVSEKKKLWFLHDPCDVPAGATCQWKQQAQNQAIISPLQNPA
jgi:hypothetical protein